VGEFQKLSKLGSYAPLRKKFAQSLEDTLVPLGLLNKFQVRGAFAEFSNELAADFKSVGASGWNSDLIPAEEILEAQFPQVLQELQATEARIAELQGRFETANEGEDEDVDLDSHEFDAEQPVLGKAVLDAIKVRKKDLVDLRKKAKSIKGKSVQLDAEIAKWTSLLLQHASKVDQLRQAKEVVRAIEKNRDQLVDRAREEISEVDAERLILNRWMVTMAESFEDRVQAHLDQLIRRIEILWEKYAVTLRELEASRTYRTEKLAQFLKELGYA
jgi:type I restriction enzyme M protein